MKVAFQQQSEFAAYSYTRTCLYFAVAALESCLNQERRAYLGAAGEDEGKIFKDLRKPFPEKLKWPKAIYGQSIPLGGALELAMKVRHEVTHPKRHDHSIYIDLDSVDLSAVVNEVSLYVVALRQASGKPFPYWILGWNYVSVFGRKVHVMQLNNMNGFYHSARNMGLISGYVLQNDWDRRNMMSPACFLGLKNALEDQHYDIEPRIDWSPNRNRLTRRWWDDDFIVASWAG